MEYEHYDKLGDYAHYLESYKTVYSLYHAHGFEWPNLPIITSEGKLEFMKWGLVPTWAKDEKTAAARRLGTLNARSDTIFEKVSFKDAIRERRGILLLDGFFEWRKFNKKSYPYYINFADRPIFGAGAIWNEWRNRDTGEVNQTFSLVTVDANPTMALIHNDGQRMPLILPKENEQVWLNESINEGDIKAIMQTYPDEHLQYRTISRLLTTRGVNQNTPAISEPCQYLELPPLNPVTLF